MASEEGKKPLVQGNSVPEYDAIFAKGTKHSQFAQKTAIGVFRNPKRFSWIEWVFLAVSTVSLLGVLGLNIERFVTFEKDFYNLSDPSDISMPFRCSHWHCTSDFTFSLLLLINLVFCFFYCYHGLFRERKFELLAYVAATVVILLYIVGNYIFDVVKHDNIPVIKKIRLALLCVFGPINIFLAVLAWWKMGYFVFNVIGANKTLTTAYHLQSFITTLQYFHVEIMANVVILSFSLDGKLLSVAETVVILVLFVYLILVVFMGSMSMSWEKTFGVISWYVLMMPFGVYYVYKLVEVSINWSKYTEEYEEFYTDGSALTSSIKFVGLALIVAVCLGLIAVVILAMSMGFVVRTFDLGLRAKVDPPLAKYVYYLHRKCVDKQ